MSETPYNIAWNIINRLSAADPAELFRKLASDAAKLEPLRKRGITSSAILDLVWERENQSPTTIGCGLILPHARIPQLESLCAVCAVLENPLDCETPDDIPVMFGCMLLIPEERPMEGLRFMADIAAVMHNPARRDRLRSCDSADEMLRLFREVRKQRPPVVIASDIMAPPRLVLPPEMPLHEATRMMADIRASAVPVLDGETLVGEILADDLFKIGVPDFFSQLKSVGFIRYFDPFEEYFSVEAASKVADVMNKRFHTLPEDATLIEIVFAISVLKCPLVYIVGERNKLLGIIDRTLLLKRIIHL
ncbi:PTS sugar transporter subunit IIA [uncultured Victivallis sp.]|uniref:PTS sugar transporter subunit IIA n=1 Tax=uncultured Victivallis sp. TaxID=354118 RepID=UPI0025D58232|nr:PTS sugar transporter subunit IIA [uncultured Victivallis sp.]